MEKDIKKTVKEAYTAIVNNGCSYEFQDDHGQNARCGKVNTKKYEDAQLKKDYSQIEGWVPEADYGLGCGVPTEYAAIKDGNTVVDLGSGAGNDAFIVRRIVGKNGRVIGIDMTEAMVEKAELNKRKLGYDNVDFYLGEIENMPIENETADVVVSNCVLNLVPDKNKAFQEINRILKENGHFSISDIVIKGNIPERFHEDMKLYAACIAGAVRKDDYMDIIENAGFKNIKVQKEKEYSIGDKILLKYMTEKELHEFRRTESGIFSITVYGEKSRYNESFDGLI